MRGLQLLDSAAERSAAPEIVGPVMRRLVEVNPGVMGRLVDGRELSPLGQAVLRVAESSNTLARLCVADSAAVEVLDHLDRPVPVEWSDLSSLARSARLSGLRIAARDLLGLDPLEEVGAALATLAGQVLEAAVALGAGEGESGLGAGAGGLAVIGMGKLGGSELNYASDVDVLFVTAEPEEAPRARRVMEVARACFRVDADLRPEGRAGPLARTVDSYRSYWRRWASAWEFQALLKARPAAGDAAVGQAFADTAEEALWGRSFSADELAELRAMKNRAEQIVARSGLAGRELKRGPGGIRDVEFAVQLLQLVHGRLDSAIRQRSTLGALAELGAAGYVSAEDATVLEDHYRFLRTVEHRLQLVEYEQTHAVPLSTGARRRLALVTGFEDDARASALERFDDDLRRRLAEVRAIHERLFFRPLLEAFGGEQKVMTPEAVEQRLAAFGFADARRTAGAVEELAGGLTRSSRLMGQLLPLLLDWLSLTPDPDLGLLGLRTLATHPHHRSVVVAAFRESPEAARRLCVLLGSSRAMSEALERNPELIARLDDDAALAPAAWTEVLDEARRRLGRGGDDEARRAQLVRLRQEQFVRIAGRDLLEVDEPRAVGAALATTAEALLSSALEVVLERRHLDAFCVIGMGRFGGAELAYASDLDVLLVHGDRSGPAAQAAGDTAAEELLHLVHGPGPATSLYRIDLGLRPEGAQGRLSRDVAGYRLYFSRWAQTWERQALLRARVVAGDEELGAQFMAAADEFLWGTPLGDDRVAEIRRMKARIERERIPSGDDPQFHLKLGRGSLSDVEWTVQLMQLRHGVAQTSTVAAIDELTEQGILEPGDAEALRSSYLFCEHTRNRWHLVGALAGGAGKGDALPARSHDLSRLARSLGTTPVALRDDYRRVTRRARRVTERLFYGIDRG